LSTCADPPLPNAKIQFLKQPRPFHHYFEGHFPSHAFNATCEFLRHRLTCTTAWCGSVSQVLHIAYTCSHLVSGGFPGEGPGTADVTTCSVPTPSGTQTAQVCGNPGATSDVLWCVVPFGVARSWFLVHVAFFVLQGIRAQCTNTGSQVHTVPRSCHELYCSVSYHLLRSSRLFHASTSSQTITTSSRASRFLSAFVCSCSCPVVCFVQNLWWTRTTKVCFLSFFRLVARATHVWLFLCCRLYVER
jgi:hypothetical protein